MSSDSDTPMGLRSIVANRQASKSRGRFDGNWLADNRSVVIIRGNTCSILRDFQIDADSRICTGTLDGNTYNGKLQDDGLGIAWRDGDTWTRMEADRADEE